MQGQYPGNRGGRPCGDRGFDHADAASARLFLCAGCRAQALICSCCDRGQIYCAADCVGNARELRRNECFQQSRPLTDLRRARSTPARVIVRKASHIAYLACLIQRIAAIRKLQLYNALNPRIDPVSRPPRPLDRREFRYVRTVWPPKPPAVRLSRH